MLECVAKNYGVSSHPFLCNPLQLWIKTSQYVDIFQALNQVLYPSTITYISSIPS